MKPIDKLIQRYRATENPLKAERRLELLLVALVCALLLMVLLGVLGSGRSAGVAAIAPAADALAPVAAASPEIPSLEQSAEMEGRPLFWASRRPVNVAAVKPKPVQEKVAPKPASSAKRLKKVQLLAVLSQGDESVAIFLAEGKRYRLKVGEEVQGWTLESVDAFGMSLRSGAEIQRVELERRQVAGNPLPVQPAATVAPEDETLSEEEAAAQRARREEADNTLSFGGG